MSKIFRLYHSDPADFTVAELVDIAQKASANQRTIERNLRLKRYQGRNSSVTTEVLIEAIDTRLAVQDHLTAIGERELAGALQAELELASRISRCRDEGIQRPELNSRLNNTRRAIRAKVRTGHGDLLLQVTTRHANHLI